MRRRILLVEDDAKTRASIELYLRHEGYEAQFLLLGVVNNPG